MIRSIPKRIKNIKRSREIADVLIKHGFGHVIARLDLKLPLGIRIESKEEKLPAPKRARLVLEELGPTFIKFGQILSMRADLIPYEYTEELKKLQDDVPGFSYKSVQKEIKKELEEDIDEIFDSFDKTPIAAASIAQVHHAVYGGEDVVVKVQRPGIEKEIEGDVEILFDLAHLIEKHIPESQLYEPVGLVNEFSKTIKRELDFMIEARNSERFKKNFVNESSVYVPTVYWEATSRRILTLEMIRGRKISDLGEELPAEKRKDLAERIAKAYMKQILVDGFFHGDPHPGNIFIADKEVIAFMDFGIMGHVDEYMKDKLSNLFIAVIQKNKDKIIEELLDIGVAGDDTSIPEFRSDIGELMDEYYGTELKQVSIPDAMNDVMKTALRHRIRIPANFALLIKTLATVESICREISSEFNFTEIAKPYVESMVAERMHPVRIANRFIENVMEINQALAIMPKRLNKVLYKLQEGKLIIDLEHKGLNKLISELDSVSNRLSMALIISALIVGSSVIMLTGKGPLIFDFPVFGIIGYFFAGLIGVFLVLSILRRGKF